MEFSFAKQTNVICGPALPPSGEPLTASPIEFSIGPGSILKLPANGTAATLNLTAKFKNSYQLLCLKAEKHRSNQPEETSKRQKVEKYTHLLIGKVKDTQVMFSFIIEAAVVE